MENVPAMCKEENKMDLPAGFRFHPTDEELISHYLYRKVTDTSFSARAIGEVDLNRCEPWDLPWKAKMGEKEWYFFCVRDRKYPTGLRTNRATGSGYWKATGKDKGIFRGKILVGMKKTLVFYKGRAPKGEKTDWVMHEYRLDGKFSVHNLPKTAKNEWVVCRVFQKSSGVKKTHFSGIMLLDAYGNELGSSALPPLTDSSPSINNIKAPSVTESAYVPCFSNPIDGPKGIFDSLSNINLIHNNNSNTPSVVYSNHSFYSTQGVQIHAPAQPILSLPDSSNHYLRTFLGNQENGSNLRNGFEQEREMVSVSQETSLSTDVNAEISSVVSDLDMGKRHFDNQNNPIASAAPMDLASLWNY